MDRWISWCCCNRRGWRQSSTWIKVVGLPVFLWDKDTFETIGKYCGGYLETAKETLSQTHFKWAKLRIKGDGREIPASVNIKVGNTLFNCPIWAERRPWVEWDSSSNVSVEDSRPPEMGRKQESVSAPAKDSTGGSQRANRPISFNGSQNSMRGHKFNTFKKGEVRWRKVSSPNGAQLNSNSNSDICNVQSMRANEESNPLMRRDELQSDTLEQIGTNKFQALSGLVIEEELIDDHNSNHFSRVSKETFEGASGDTEIEEESSLSPGRLGSPTYWRYPSVQRAPPLNLEDEHPEEEGLDYESENMLIPFELLEDTEERAIICQPLASYGPDEDWPREEECLQLQNCGQDQSRISAWVLNRMRSFKRILGISCEGFEDRLMELLQRIEEKRKTQHGDQRKQQRGSSRKGVRELKNLQCSISYEKEAKESGLGVRRGDGILSLSFQ